MPAMHSEVLAYMDTQLEGFRDRMVQLIPFNLSHQECLELVAPSEHIPILINAAKVAELSSDESWFGVQVPTPVDGEAAIEVMLMMRTHAEEPPPLRPRHPEWQPHKPGGAKVHAWATKRLELGRRFGAAKKVLYRLVDVCDNGAQLRFILPAVMHLVSGAGSDTRAGKWAEKHAAFVPVKHAPALSPEVRAAVRDVGALLTSCVLIGDNANPLNVEPSATVIDVWKMPVFTSLGGLTTRL